MEQPKPYEPSEEKILKATKERTLSDAELIRGGAEPVFDIGAEEPRLEITKEEFFTKSLEKESSSLQKEVMEIRERLKTDPKEYVIEILNESGIKENDYVGLILGTNPDGFSPDIIAFRNANLDKMKSDTLENIYGFYPAMVIFKGVLEDGISIDSKSKDFPVFSDMSKKDGVTMPFEKIWKIWRN